VEKRCAMLGPSFRPRMGASGRRACGFSQATPSFTHKQIPGKRQVYPGQFWSGIQWKKWTLFERNLHIERQSFVPPPLIGERTRVAPRCLRMAWIVILSYPTVEDGLCSLINKQFVYSIRGKCFKMRKAVSNKFE